jgi:flagellar motor switch protein FliM
VTGARALSQLEIDALLNQIPEGGNDTADLLEAAPTGLAQRDGSLGRGIKNYDFRRPDKFSKEQWQTLQAMHEAFARLIGASFSSRLRSLVTARLSSIEQGLYEEWQTQVPSPTSCYVVGLPPLAGSIVVEFNQDVAAEVVDRLLGGTGSLVERTRELTEIEVTLLRAFSSAVISALQDMWEKVSPVQPELQDMGRDASVIQIAGPNDVVIMAFFEVNLGSHLGAMSVCIPYAVVEPITDNLSAQIWHSSSAQVVQTEQTRRRVEAVLRAAPLELAVELGSIELPAREVLELSAGDTLVLDAPVNRQLSLVMGGAVRFHGRPGMVGKRLATRITDVVQLPPDPAADDEVGDADPGASDRLEADGGVDGLPAGVPPQLAVVPDPEALGPAPEDAVAQLPPAGQPDEAQPAPQPTSSET